jgi:hypothetical protein
MMSSVDEGAGPSKKRIVAQKQVQAAQISVHIALK